MPSQDTPGTDADVRQRVRRFYGHWASQLFDPEGNHALVSDDVDVEPYDLSDQRDHRTSRSLEL